MNEDNDVIDEKPKHSLPNCIHHELDDLSDVVSKGTDQALFTKSMLWK